MEYSSKKKNTDNYYQSKNLILEYEDEDYSTDTIIGSYCGVQKLPSSSQQNEEMPIKYTTNYIDEEYTINTCSFNNISHLFKKYKICRVNMNYYPFISSYIEDTYRLFYSDIAETNKCPACNYYYDNLIYVIDNYIVLCDTCYSRENIIKYI